MTTVYCDDLEHLDEDYKDKLTRNRRARVLRKEGWVVECKTWHFRGLPDMYSLKAKRERKD